MDHILAPVVTGLVSCTQLFSALQRCAHACYPKLAHVVCNRLEPRSLVALVSLICLPSTIVTVGLRSLDVKASFIMSFATYVLSLVTATVCYRLSPYHPLAAYPGPLAARITRLWAVCVYATRKQHLVYDALHKQYGDYVRLGPNHLHIRDASAIQVIMGQRTQWDRSEGQNCVLISHFSADRLEQALPSSIPSTALAP
jgi:hypothetical protein